MLIRARKTASTLAIIAAAGLGGSALAGAASSGSTSTTITTASKSRTALSAENAAKVKAAALAKVPGATVDRVSSGGSYATPYHAHITTSGGTKQVVLVDASFNATTVQADTGRGGKGGGRDGRGETALTGATKTKVEAAVKAKYPGATIERTETNRDAAAPYESHITTAGGQDLEVLVSQDFKVVSSR